MDVRDGFKTWIHLISLNSTLKSQCYVYIIKIRKKEKYININVILGIMGLNSVPLSYFELP